MELKSFETGAIVLTIAGMLDDVTIRRIEMPISKEQKEIILYSASSKDGRLDIYINPEKKDNFKAEFGENLTKLYNFACNAKAPLTPPAVDKMQKNWETMVPLIANIARAGLLKNQPSKELAKRRDSGMNGFETMVMNATPLTTDSFISLTSFCLAPQFYSVNPIDADELKRRLRYNRHALTTIIRKDKEDFINLMMSKNGASLEEAKAIFDEVFGNEDTMLM